MSVAALFVVIAVFHVLGLAVGWFAAKSLYSWGYGGHHHEYWRGWDDRYDVVTDRLRHRYADAPTRNEN